MGRNPVNKSGRVTAPPEVEPFRRKRRAATSVVVLLICAALVTPIALFIGQGGEEDNQFGVQEVTDASFVAEANAKCASYAPAIQQVAQQAVGGSTTTDPDSARKAEAEVTRSLSTVFTKLVTDLEKIEPADSTERKAVDEWLKNWKQSNDLAIDYAAALESGDSTVANAVADKASSFQPLVFGFAERNELTNCMFGRGGFSPRLVDQ